MPVIPVLLLVNAGYSRVINAGGPTRCALDLHINDKPGQSGHLAELSFRQFSPRGSEKVLHRVGFVDNNNSNVRFGQNITVWPDRADSSHLAKLPDSL